MPIEVLTAEEVARLLGCDPEYVNALAATHELPAIKIGLFWRFPAGALATHLDAQANANLLLPPASEKLARRGGRKPKPLPDLTRCVLASSASGVTD